ncbi:MAG: hypothetical protein IPM48_05695 [Saprospiraceae bacterium]|nr:hypothetical protein [Saprospiraceae bacterium]
MGISGFYKFNHISYTFGMVFIGILAMMYLKHLVDNGAHQFSQSPMFYLSFGILFFYTACFTILLLNPLIMKIDIGLSKEIYVLVKVGNIILSLSYLQIAYLNWKTEN